MASISDFIRNMIGVMELKERQRMNDLETERFSAQKQQAANAERRAGIEDKQKFIAFLQQLPPEARAAYIRQVSGNAQFDSNAATEIADTTPNTLANMLAQSVQAGLSKVDSGEVAGKALAGMSLGELALSALRTRAAEDTKRDQNLYNQFVNRTLTGQSAGANAVDQAIAGKPADELGRAASYSLGTALNPMQQGQLAQGWAGLGIQEQGASTSRLGVENQYDLGLKQLLMGREEFMARLAAGKDGNQALSGADRAGLLKEASALAQFLGSGPQNKALEQGSVEMLKQMARLGGFNPNLFAPPGTQSPSVFQSIFRR